MRGTLTQPSIFSLLLRGIHIFLQKGKRRTTDETGRQAREHYREAVRTDRMLRQVNPCDVNLRHMITDV